MTQHTAEECLRQAEIAETRMIEMKKLGDKAAERYFKTIRDMWLSEAAGEDQ